MGTVVAERGGAAATGAYEQAIDTLDAELRAVEAVFRGLSGKDWEARTKLDPIDSTQPHWTVFELAGHFDISIGLARMLIAAPQEGQTGRDRASFFIFPRSEVAPVVYDYAYKMVAGKKPADMPGVLHETFSKTIEEARRSQPDLVGPGYYALMRIDEFIPSRVVEAVVHGMDLTDALGRPDRMNTPGTVGPHNWTWRLPWTIDQLFTEPEPVATARELAHLAERHDRKR